jgi:acid stress-induced BolA-like protein IbaG/YrbA
MFVESFFFLAPGRRSAGYHTQRAVAIGKARNSGYTSRPLGFPVKLMDPSDITRLIEAGFANASVRVESDDNTHFAALVVAEEFEGVRKLQRHQMVYKTLGTLVGNEIHALSLRTLTPAEYADQAG